MPSKTKRTVGTALPQEELEELDRVCEGRNMSRAAALREALRWYLGTIRGLPPAEEPLPEEVEALREAHEEFARGGGRALRDVLNDLEHRSERSG